MANDNKIFFVVNRGFTLVELLVGLGIVGILALFGFMLFNPVTQLNRAKDATRESNFIQIRTALDTYYHDRGCYPLSIPFGSIWSQGLAIYMQKVPDDPDCGSNPALCYHYRYETDGTLCPQWHVLYAAMKAPSNATNRVLCPLEKMTTCLPKNYSGSGYNFCIVSGNPNCSYISQNLIP
jgi:prepilin-type N-terminal cleavage/methylation domain-containing protein